jgi:hypothetical protein
MAAEIELIAAAVTGAVTGGVVKPILAPADALAEYWKERVHARLDRVSKAATRKHGASVVVNERIAFRVLMEAAFTDDDVVAEYLAGVISGTGAAHDDAAPILAQIGRLSAISLRLHYVAYRELWRLARDGEIAQGRYGWSWWQALYFPHRELQTVFDEEFQSLRPRLALAGKALVREGLLLKGRVAAFQLVDRHQEIEFSNDETPLRFVAPESGLVVGTCPTGIELFLWACGHVNESPDAIHRLSEAEVSLDPPLPSAAGQRVVRLHRIDQD